VGYLNRIVVNEVRSRHRQRGARRNARLLPHRQRETLLLRYWLDLPLGEIARVMRTRIGTVKSQLSRGLGTIGAALLAEAEQ
jgi:DNA-directed RNA polymerase specialized sigma24 family protein